MSVQVDPVSAASWLPPLWSNGIPGDSGVPLPNLSTTSSNCWYQSQADLLSVRMLMSRLESPKWEKEEVRVSSSSSRILYDVPCKVCADFSSGKHYGIFACDGCAGFFKRTIRRGREYPCKNQQSTGSLCKVDKTHRNQCRGCRLRRCLEVGMNRESVQHERGPRTATIRRQVGELIAERERKAESNNPTLPNSSFQDMAFNLPFYSFPAPFLPFPSVYSPCKADTSPSSSPPAPLSPPTSSPGYSPLTPPPSLTPLPLTRDQLCEVAAQNLELICNWLRTLPPLRSLPPSSQARAITSSWPHLFLLQCSLQPSSFREEELNLLLSPTCTPMTLTTFRNCLASLRSLNLTPEELPCVKALLLFQGDSGDSRLFEQAQLGLARASNANQTPLQSVRFARILITLRSIEAFNSRFVHSIFFADTIKDDLEGRESVLDRVVLARFLCKCNPEASLAKCSLCVGPAQPEQSPA